MIPRNQTMLLLLTLTLAGCVDRGDWRATAQVGPQTLEASQTLAGTQVNPDAWPVGEWWRHYGDPQLDALVSEALAGNPSLETARARLRAAQAQAIAARGALLPSTSLDGSVTRQRFPVHGLYPPPYGGSYFTEGQLTLDFSYDLDFWGHNRALAAAARSGVQAAQADQAAARLALAVAVVRAYIQLDLQYALLDVTNENLKQQTAIRD